MFPFNSLVSRLPFLFQQPVDVQLNSGLLQFFQFRRRSVRVVYMHISDQKGDHGKHKHLGAVLRLKWCQGCRVHEFLDDGIDEMAVA